MDLISARMINDWGTSFSCCCQCEHVDSNRAGTGLASVSVPGCGDQQLHGPGLVPGEMDPIKTVVVLQPNGNWLSEPGGRGKILWR